MKRVVVALLVTAAPASADPDLTLHHTPVQHLAMRRTAASPTSHTSVPPRPRRGTAPPAPSATSAKPNDYGDTGARDPNQAVGFQLDVGYAIDGTQVADNPTTLGGKHVTLGTDFAQTRTYGFADAFLSTHGVGYQPLSTYFAARYEITRDPIGPDARTGGATSVPLAPPIASWFDHSNLLVRSGWGELDNVLPERWGMPVQLRVGQLYVYGPWVMHIQGALASWHGKIFDASVYAGRRAPDYTYALIDANQPTIAGASAKIDLRGTQANVPIVIAGETMHLDYADGTSSNHLQGELDWRPRRDMVVLGQARSLDGKLANEHVQLRSRFKQVTNLVLDLQIRQSDDWQWDPSVVGQPTDASEARRYLDLGPVQPQALGSLRAGTVFFDNVDVLGRAAFARDLGDKSDRTSTNANYYEVAGALEVRLRRTFAIGISALHRSIDHPTDAPIVDGPGAQELPLEVTLGQESFTELGASARMSLGARRLSATVEVYGRSTQYTQPYCTPGATSTDVMPVCASALSSGFTTDDVRGGGRFTVDAYIGKRLRLFAAYDLSSNLDLAKETTGYKSLRLVMEGVY